MKWLKKHQGLLASFAVFTVGLVVWLAAVLGMDNVLAAPAGFGTDLRSGLTANYSQEDSPGAFRMISLAIVREALQDQTNPSSSSDMEEMKEMMDELEENMSQQVATATALNFDGDPPPTVTSTPSPTWTKTPTPTPSNTPEPTATRTWTPSSTPSDTPKPSKTPKPPDPTKTPDPTPKDKQQPIVNPEGDLVVSTDPENLDLDPSGEICTFTISMEQACVEDPAPSSGIEWVKMKYKVEGYTDYHYSDHFTITCGEFDGEGAWYGCYMGSVEVEIEKDWGDPAVVKVWLRAMDGEGNETYYYVRDYEVSCIEDD